MDDLSAKLKKLFKPKPKGVFKGKGNVLGGSVTATEQSRPPSRAPPKEHRPDHLRPQRPAQILAQPPASKAGVESRRAQHVPSPQQSGLDSTLLAERPESTVSLDAEEQQQIEQATALLLSAQQGSQSSSTIAKVLANIVAHPAEAKYRKLRLANKRIQETVVDVDGGVELLQACGFELVFQEGSGEQLEASENLEGFAVLPEHADLAPLQAALQLLGHREPAQQPCSSSAGAASSHSASSSGAAGQALRTHSDSVTSAGPQRLAGNAAGAGLDAGKAAKRPRNTQVFFPAETSDQAAPPKWFFDQSPSQVKAAFLAKRKKTELDQTLMTRAYREKLNGAKQDVNSIASATIRIRLPEGLVLQGEFNAGEPVSAVFEWLTDCLSDPGCMYELVGPDRKPVSVAAQSMRRAQLVPSALLNFRRLSSAPQQQPTLRQDILRLVK